MAMSKFEIMRYKLESGRTLFIVEATLSDGRKTICGEPKTEKGAKFILSREARRHGFVIVGDVAQAA